MTWRAALLSLLMMAATGPALAATPDAAPAAKAAQRMQRVRALIVQAGKSAGLSPASVKIGSLEAVSDMPQCPKRPSVDLMGRGTYRDAKVRCRSLGWQLYVPIEIHAAQREIVAAHDLNAGQVLRRSDVKVRVTADDDEGTSGIARDMSSVVGKTLRVPVSAGTPITLVNVASVERIHSGQTVTVRVESGPVEIKATAIAMQDAAAGQSILVKNPESGKIYRVEVTKNEVIDDIGG